jgi:hypothetical protein
MGKPVTPDQIIAEVWQRWHVTLTHKQKQEWAGPCPFCSLADKDGFLVWTERGGRYWCRQCGAKGWLDAGKDPSWKPTPEELEKMRLERLERQMAELQERVAALEAMARCSDHLTYHSNLDTMPQALEWWLAQGVTVESVYKWELGYCPRCPTDAKGRASYTIPVIAGGSLKNIRHRLHASSKDKYRPHRPGLGAQLFGADLLKDAGVVSPILVEGEKKVIVLRQQGLPAIGTYGNHAFSDEWFDLFGYAAMVTIAFDPGAEQSAWLLGKRFVAHDIAARVARFNVKPDDFFTDHELTRKEFDQFLAYAWKVKP